MPEFNPANAYNQTVDRHQNVQPGNTLGQGNYKGLAGRVNNYLSNRSADEQFEFDTAMWYGAITHTVNQWKADMLKRLFLVLSYGGLMVHREDGWESWASLGAPISASISHGARVLICLPENDNQGAFWQWLWGNHQPETRGAATHGVRPLPQTVDIAAPLRVMKGIMETKGDENVKHYGINVGLGGHGKMNPISGKTISEQNGKHGHLYIAYYTEIKHTFKRNEAVARRAILVNCEQSAPIDRQVADKGTAGKLKSVFRGINVPDQYGGGHGLGGHSRFGATGGDDFSYESGGRLAPTKLGEYGPSRGHYYDGMYLDLSADRFDFVRAHDWEDSIIGRVGLPPIPPKPPRVRGGAVDLGRRN